MKRQQAFIDNGCKFQKGGLHTHTTRSDTRFDAHLVAESCAQEKRLPHLIFALSVAIFEAATMLHLL